MSNVVIPEFLANVPNIEHCSEIRPVGNPARVYVITTEDGWYIHKDTGVEEMENIWKTTTSIQVTADPSILTILAEADLPEGAEILDIGGGNTEVANIEYATEEDYIKALESMGVDFNG